MADPVKIENQNNGNKRKMIFECGFAVLIILLVAGYLFGVTFMDIPKANSRVVDTILGFLLGSVISPIIIWAFKNSKHSTEMEKENKNNSKRREP